MTDFVVLIPARYAATRLPGKPLRTIAGVPLIERVVRQAQKSNAHTVAVATDDDRIAAVCASIDVPCVMTESAHPSGTDRVAEAADILKLPDETIVVNVQGDEPFIAPECIDAVACTLAENTTADVATAAISQKETIHDPNVVRVVCDSAQHALYFSRAQIPFYRANVSVETRYLMHIGIYAYHVRTLRRFVDAAPAPIEIAEQLEQLRVLWYGGRIAVHLCDFHETVGIDTESDIARAESFIRMQGDCL